MRLDELTLPDDHSSLTRLLFSRGWQEIGMGYYASVYSKQGLNYVLKVFEQDSAYLAFLNMIKNNPNPHFPKIIGKIRIGDPWGENTYRAVRMEKLYELRTVEVDGLRVSITGMCTAYLQARKGTNKLSQGGLRDLELANLYLEDKPTMVEALDLICDQLLRKYSLDLGNDIMQRRDGTPVFVDPIDK